MKNFKILENTIAISAAVAFGYIYQTLSALV